MIPSQFDDLIAAAQREFLPAVDYRLLKAQWWEESDLNPKAKSPAGAMGLTQCMPGTWADWTKKLNMQGADPFDVEDSIWVGTAYMGWLWGEWKSPRPQIDRYLLAAASYNSGIGDILKAQKIMGGPALYADIMRGLPQADPNGWQETTNYGKRILEVYNKLVLGA